jgi:hypothetical protein
MKNEQKFKQRIAEVAAKIAGLKEEYKEEETNLPSAALTKLNSVINSSPDLAKAIHDIIKEIIAKEPSLSKIETITGWSMIMDKLKQLSGKKAGEEVPDVSAADQKDAAAASADKAELPNLKEAYNRINRK